MCKSPETAPKPIAIYCKASALDQGLCFTINQNGRIALLATRELGREDFYPVRSVNPSRCHLLSVSLPFLCALLGAVTCTPAAEPPPPAFTVPETFPPHPRLFVDAKELAAMNERVTSSQFPHVLAWQALEKELATDVPPKPYVGDDPPTFSKIANRQAARTRDLALACWITGDSKYADQAVDYLAAWSQAKPTPGREFRLMENGEKDPGVGIHLVRGTLGFIYAADLLWDYPGFTPEKKAAFEKWLRVMIPQVRECKELWKNNDYFGKQDFNNHLATHALGLAAMGSYLGDRDLVQFAIASPENERDYTDLIEGLILMPGDETHRREKRVDPNAPPPQKGEMYDRYRHYTGPMRGLQYSHLAMNMMAQTAEVGRHLGLDLWNYTAPGGETLRLPFEYYSDFYRLGDSSLKHGLYKGETARMGKALDTPATFELGLARFPDSQPLRDLLWVTDRPIHRCHTLGPVLLTHGFVFPEQAGLTPRPKPPEPAPAPVAKGINVPASFGPHPRLLLDKAGLDAMRERALSGQEPWRTAWSELQARAESAIARLPKWKPYTGDDPSMFYKSMLPQAEATRDLALAWWITGEQKYAEAARRIIGSWLAAQPLPGTIFPKDQPPAGLKGMMIPRSILPMIWSYDILGGGDTMPKADRTAFTGWLRALVPQLKEGALYWKKNGYFDAQYFQNHLAGENMGLVAIGVTCGDADLLRYAVNSAENNRDFLDLIEGLILMPGQAPYYRDLPGAPTPQAGEIIDRYRHFEMAGHAEDYVSKPNRGLQYAMLSSHLLGITAQMLATNGLDLWSYQAPGGENLRLPFAFYAPIYAAMNASAQGGFYRGEQERMTFGGDSRAIFEIAAARYPDDPAIARVLDREDRAKDTTELLGFEALIFGANAPGEASKTTNPEKSPSHKPE
jgi:hypothetical protein